MDDVKALRIFRLSRLFSVVNNSSRDMHPEKIIALTRWLLQSATTEDSQQTFLKKVSEIFFELSGCEALEILHNDHGRDYHWTVGNSAGSSCQYQIITSETNDTLHHCLSETKADKLFHFLVNELNFHQAFAQYSDRGSFFLQSSESLPSDIIHQATSYKSRKLQNSLAIIPFTISDDNFGVIILTCDRPDTFTASSITLLEEMVLTFGWASSERNNTKKLREQNRRQSCMCQISEIVKQRRPFLEYYGKEGIQSLLREMVKLLTSSCQSPGDVSTRIILDDVSYNSNGFREGQSIRRARIAVAGKNRGAVEVHCLREDSTVRCRSIFPDEQNLVDEVAQLVGLLVEKHEATEERENFKKQMHHADRLATIGELAAGVAHEINEPLGNILGFTQLVGQGLRDCDYQLDEIGAIQTKQDLERIEAATLHTREIVRDLLIFARQVPPKQVELDINQQLDLVISFFLSRCAKASISLKMRKADALPPIIADQTQINQMMVNLITNAIHAMPDGGDLTIATGLCDDDSELSVPCVWLKISDTGIGISESNREKVFQPFFTTKDVKRGTGLGLSVVHSIVKSYKGKIYMESIIGKGTTFTVLLPLVGVDEKNSGMKN